MKILVDENIPYGKEAFGTLGDVETAPGRSITKDMLTEVNALMVRSITRVNEDLLSGTPVQFVGTATIGEDHIDRAYLAQNGIGFSSAPGCNANSVAEYIVASLLELRKKHVLNFSEMRLGVIGIGNVGSKVVRKAQALGLEVVQNDPPLAETTQNLVFQPLDAIFDCDIITLHVPLNKSGRHPTYHLVDHDFLSRLKENVILINTARGAVADNVALKNRLQSGKMREAILDVWEGEPNPDLELLARCFIATPHIAGYSFDGKVNGTVQIYQALCEHLGIAADWRPDSLLPAPDCPEWHVPSSFDEPLDVLHQAVTSVYDIMQDDKAMRGILDKSTESQGKFFDLLRKEYPRRREFQNTKIVHTGENHVLDEMFQGIGFDLSS